MVTSSDPIQYLVTIATGQCDRRVLRDYASYLNELGQGRADSLQLIASPGASKSQSGPNLQLAHDNRAESRQVCRHVDGNEIAAETSLVAPKQPHVAFPLQQPAGEPLLWPRQGENRQQRQALCPRSRRVRCQYLLQPQVVIDHREWQP
jgi:hypothetical protein